MTEICIKIILIHTSVMPIYQMPRHQRWSSCWP